MCLPVEKYVFRVEREWNHAGLLCAVVQGEEHSHRCGYVRVPPTHPFYKQDYDKVDVDIHGGLTFAAIEPCDGHKDGVGWWFGFDCAHTGDALYDPNNPPDHFVRMQSSYPGFGKSLSFEHFWSLSEVVAETNRLAEQLAVAGN